ncbi:ATP-binding cassette subfamily C protein CydD [Herbihabitans rhizosphaerae]|uniref:ATP-binding cassette subfamily C protein CydD n=1 Tax=Herbihabitans rhizosphaerae TaxID=1872711 RepID=A0A4Q7L4U3_9PSEU|nr:thiol reductant ABC exporter subunit CydD [Herbihabitans rhizosphaerae]RZS44315.1 ATP-binding cassette subfamily C protein CydD [Herbihabitans rhizosphaerae]
MIDKVLLHEFPRLRRYLGTLAIFASLTAVLVLAQAEVLARLLSGGASWTLFALAAAVLAVRAISLWWQGNLASRVAARVQADVRSRVLRSAAAPGGAPSGEVSTLVTRGVDAIEPYVAGYLPTVLVSVTVPLAVVARLFFVDWPSALIIALTLPLVPLFAALVGAHTRRRTERQYALLSRLGGHFLDVARGLRTLMLHGRARAQSDTVRRMAGEHASATMGTLRVAFLSALVLELVATLSVALVAVPVGLRLLTGGVTLLTALLVLLLAPEAYLPLRAAGARFHASAEGLAVLRRAIDLEPISVPHKGKRVDARTAVIRFEKVTVRYPSRPEPALNGVSLTVRPGERVVLVGPSGAGKSTLIGLLLGLVEPDEGQVTVDGVDLRDIDLDWWRTQLSWVPQRPWLFAGSLADNVRLSRPDATDDEVRAAAHAAGLDRVFAARGDSALDERGSGLSSGERQRVALARALLRTDSPIALLDEPTARLDVRTEHAVLSGWRRLTAGRTSIAVAHRPALLAGAHRVVRVHEGRTA